MINLLQLLREKVDPSKIKQASSSRPGGEYHSPCPLCGGTDRFTVFPGQDGGELCQRHGIPGTWSCPRGCGKGGDVISWFMEVEGLSFAEACAELKIPLEGREQPRRSYRPLRVPRREQADAFAPTSHAPPMEQWRIQATKLTTEAHARLLETPAMLRYLAARALPEAAVCAYRLGYIEAEGKQADCIFRARAAFGLPEKKGAQGKAIRAFRIPRGITIPVWSDEEECLRIRIRRRDADRDKTNPKDPKYLLVPQPGQPFSAPLMLPPVDVPADLATWVIVEAELDAMVIHHACGGAVGVLSILTVRAKPDQAAHAALARAARILVALDVDEDKPDGSNPGADAWPWWKRTYPQAKLWPVPEGKDPGEAFARGVDLAAWIASATPLHRGNFGLSTGQQSEKRLPGDSVPAGGAVGKNDNRRSVQKGAGLMWPRWQVPDVATFADVVLPSDKITHGELLKALRKHPLGDADCLIPCPRTSPSFWWRYHRDCHRCSGHHLCLLDLLQSQLFQEAAYGTADVSCESVHCAG